MKNLLFFSFLIFASSAFCQENLFRKGSEEYILGNTENALLYIYQAYKQNPQDEEVKKLLSQIYLDMAAKYVSEGNYVEASKYLDEADKLKENVEKVKELKKAVEELKKPPKKKTPRRKIKPKLKPKPKRGKTVKKVNKKISKTPPAPAPPIVIEKKVVEEKPVPAISGKLKVIIAGVFALIVLVLVFLFIYVEMHIKHQKREAEEFLREKEKREKILQSELFGLKTETERLKAQLEVERRKKYEAAKAMIEQRKETTDEKTYEKISRKIDEIKTAAKPGKTKKKSELKHIPIESLLPEYTEIPTTTEELENLLKIAGPSDRGKIFWALGNKKDIKAVEILSRYLEGAKGNDFREILKSLKKISLRPGIDEAIQNKIQEIFANQRKKGIII